MLALSKWLSYSMVEHFDVSRGRIFPRCHTHWQFDTHYETSSSTVTSTYLLCFASRIGAVNRNITVMCVSHIGAVNRNITVMCVSRIGAVNRNITVMCVCFVAWLFCFSASRWFTSSDRLLIVANTLRPFTNLWFVLCSCTWYVPRCLNGVLFLHMCLA